MSPRTAKARTRPERAGGDVVGIRTAVADDARHVAAIYNHYVADTVVTFETAPVAADAMYARLRGVQDAGLPWLVAEQSGDGIVGYAYAAPWKPRDAYRFAVESTIYLAPGTTGRGIGRRLYEALLQQLQQRGLHTAIGGIALPNAASVALHEALGFARIAHFREVGFKFGGWIDVGYWQRMLR